MTAVVDMASIPPWRQALLEKKRIGGDIDERGPGQEEPSGRNRDFLSKKQIGENTFYYSHPGSVSSRDRDYNKNDTLQIEKVPVVRPSNSDMEVLIKAKDPVAEWNLPTAAESEQTPTNMVSSSNHKEVNANGPTPSSEITVNGVLVDEERISSVLDNPFVKNFGLKRPSSAEIRPTRVSSASLSNDVDHNSQIANHQTESSNDSAVDNTDSVTNEIEEEYHPGSGFVHKILDKFALLTAKEEALHPSLIHITRRSSSLENLVDDPGKKSQHPHRISVGDEVFTSSGPKSNFQYQSKAKSVENLLTNKPYDRHHSETYESRHRTGLDPRDGRYRSGSEYEVRHRTASDLRRSHPAPDANLGREDIIIIETTPSPRPVEDDPMKHAYGLRRPRTSSSERPPDDELPRPNTVKAQRKKFELKQQKDDPSSQKRKKNKAPSVPGGSNSTTTHVNNDSNTKDSKQMPDHINELLKQNGDNSKDSSFDTQTDISADSSIDVVEQVKDYENPVYDAIRASLRHVKPRSEGEEITYSWKRGSGSDWLDNAPSNMGPVGPPKTSILNKTTTTSKVENNHSSTFSTVSNKMTNNSVTNNSVSIKTSTTVPDNSATVPAAVSKQNDHITSAVNTPRSTDSEKSSSTTQLKKMTSSGVQQNSTNTQVSSVMSTQLKTSTGMQPRPVPPRKSKVKTTQVKETNSSNSSQSVISTTRTEVTEFTVETKAEQRVTNTTAKVPTIENNISQTAPSKAPEPKVTTALEPKVAPVQTKPSKPKTMVMVGPAAQTENSRSDFRSRNRFDSVASKTSDSKIVNAGKSQFYEAGKFKANPEGVKRQSNSRSSDPVPRKRAAPTPPGVTLLNLTDDSIDSQQTPRSNIDDYIASRFTDMIPVTDIDISYADTNSASAGGAGAVPRLDLSSITSDSNNKPKDPYYRGPRKVQPCNYQFSGANVVVGKSLLQVKKKSQKLKLCFDDTLTSTYEYPSEELMLEEYLAEHPDEKELVFTLDDYIADTNESSDDMDPTMVHVETSNTEEDHHSTLKSTPGIGGNSSGLSSYRAKYQMDYEFGMEFERQAQKEREEQLRQEQELQNKTDDGDLVPADEDDLSAFSTSSTSDMLF